MDPFQSQRCLRYCEDNLVDRPDLLRIPLQLFSSTLLLHTQRGDTFLVYPRFIPCDLLDRVTKYGGVVHSECGDSCCDGFGNDIGGVVCPTDTYFQDGGCDAKGEEGVEGKEGQQAEVDRKDGGKGREGLSSAQILLAAYLLIRF